MNDPANRSNLSQGLSCISKTRFWLDQNKVFFETAAATFLAVMAIVISLVQLNLAAKQTSLSELQTEIAQKQLAREEKLEAIGAEVERGELKLSIWNILDMFPPSGIESLKRLSLDDRSLWLSEIQKLLESQASNKVLIRGGVTIAHWNNALSAARMAASILTTSRGADPENIFMKTAFTIFGDVMDVWKDLFIMPHKE